MNAYRKLSSSTTDEQIMEPVESAKRNLADAVAASLDSNVMNGEELVRAAQRVMDAEAVANVAWSYRQIMDDDAAATKYLLKQLALGADDSWSGRGNDAKRSAFDAVREFCSNEFDNIQYR